jgi:hypothetical protein
VADKVPSPPALWTEGVLFGALFFIAARFRLWLGIALVPVTAFMIYFDLDFLVWSSVGESARQELGAGFPLAVVGSAIIHALGHLSGLAISFRRRCRHAAHAA